MIGAAGEMYPCDAGIFARTYDWVEDKADPVPQPLGVIQKGLFN